jgi:hypothetical protein
MVLEALELNRHTLFDIATCHDIVKAARKAGIDPLEVAQTAQAFHTTWRDALETTREQRAGEPH